MKKISQIIGGANEQLSKLITVESALKKLRDELVALSIFEANSEAYRVTKFTQGILYLSVSNSAFATQVRHITPSVLKTLQSKLPDIQLFAIQCKVSSFSEPEKKAALYRKHKTKDISEKTRAKLSKLSETINSEPLRVALKKLGRS